MEKKLIIVQTAVSDIAIANTMATMLIESHLAACIKIIPGVTSFYLWNNRLNSDIEFVIQIKTIGHKFEDVKAAILKLHPYDVPEIISTVVDEVHDEYYDWAFKVTHPEAGE